MRQITANNIRETGQTQPLVSREVAAADAVFVLRWLLQMHEHSRGKIKLPDNIETLSRRALNGFGAEVREQIEFERSNNRPKAGKRAS